MPGGKIRQTKSFLPVKIRTDDSGHNCRHHPLGYLWRIKRCLLRPLGGQNFIERAVLGTPAVTGPYLDDFAWAGEGLFSQKVVTICNDGRAVAQTMIGHLEAPVKRSEQKQRTRNYIQKKQGSTNIACLIILDLFEQ